MIVCAFAGTMAGCQAPGPQHWYPDTGTYLIEAPAQGSRQAEEPRTATQPEIDARIEEKRRELALLEERIASLQSREHPVEQRACPYFDPEQAYQVRKGDSLWKIAANKAVYGNPYLWQKLWTANRDIIRKPNKIYPGQLLIVPDKNNQ